MPVNLLPAYRPEWPAGLDEAAARDRVRGWSRSPCIAAAPDTPKGQRLAEQAARMREKYGARTKQYRKAAAERWQKRRAARKASPCQ